MKKFLIVLVVLLLISGTAIAQGLLTKEISGTVEIVEGTVGFEIYDDPQMTVLSDNWTVGELPLGGWVKRDFIVKGTGTQSVKVGVRLKHDLVWGELRVIPEWAWVRPDGFQQFSLYLYINHETGLGQRDFTIEFYEVE